MGCRAVVFDLDGTLIDSAPDLLVAVNKLTGERGRRALTLGEVVGMIGDGATKLVERALTATGGVGDEDVDDATARFLAHYEGNVALHTRPYPGVTETLAALRAAGWRLAVCTNKPERPTLGVLRDLDLAEFFSAVVGGDSLDGVRKPDPRALTETLERLEVSRHEAAMVGDNANDVGAARAAGIPVVVRAGGYTRTPAADLGADLVIDDFAQLPAALDRLVVRSG